MIEIEKEETDRGRLVGNLERLLLEGKILLKYLWQLSNILVMLRCAPEFERPGSGGEVSNEDTNILCSMQNFFFFVMFIEVGWREQLFAVQGRWKISG